ncbi:MAG: histidine triad nucleotide-binding protein [Dehalococcoidia bacterium]
MSTEDCIFCKIRQGEVEGNILYQDDHCFVIQDIRPKAPVHLLIIPNQHITGLAYITPASEPTVGHLFVVAEEMARRQGVTLSGYRLVLNQGPDSGQEVSHIHLHLLGGRRLGAMG